MQEDEVSKQAAGEDVGNPRGAITKSTDDFSDDVQEEINRMMWEGGVAPPVQPKPWQEWMSDANPDEEL